MFYVSHIDPILNFVTAQVYTNYNGDNPREIFQNPYSYQLLGIVIILFLFKI